MEAEGLKSQTAFITRKELERTQDKLEQKVLANQAAIKKDLSKRMDNTDKQVEKLDGKVDGIDDKVDQLKDLVLLLTVHLKQTADNTKEISQSLKEFTSHQMTTNNLFHDKFGVFGEKINGQALAIEGLRSITGSLTERKKYNLGITVAALGIVAAFVTGLFQLAPTLVPLIFK